MRSLFSRSIVLATAVLAASSLIASRALAGVITFDDGAVAENATLSTQYSSSLGVTFVNGTGGATGVANPTATTQGFATLADLTIVSSTGSDVGGGLTAPISGLLLHSFDGWLDEDGDAVFRINFASPISSISIDFGGVADVTSSGIQAVNGANAVIGSAFTTVTGTSTVTLTPSSPVSSVIITEGDYNDWVGIDNINFTSAVPEPASIAMLGVGATSLLVRRRQAQSGGTSNA